MIPSTDNTQHVANNIIEIAERLIPTSVTLHYVDYSDDLDEQMPLLQRCIDDNSLCPFYEESSDWFMDDHYAMDEILKELKSDIANEFEIDEDDVDTIIDENFTDIQEIVWDRDDSTVESDLLRNTSSIVMNYNTGLEVPSDSWNWTDKEISRQVKLIKAHLKIKTTDKRFDSDIEMMVRQASYGGELVVYFRAKIEDVVGIDKKSVKFTDPVIAIINTCNGSGDDCSLQGHSCNFEWDNTMLTIDKTIKYNYTYSVCGMSSDWCDSTIFEFHNRRGVKVGDKNSISAIRLENAKYDKTFKDGGCTTGDMDINRHRNTEYINSYPCGNKCKDCGTFWID